MKWFSLLYQGDVHPSSDEKIISAEDYSALLSAFEIVERAKEDSEKFLQKAKEEGKKLKEQAKIEGYQQGLEDFNSHLLQLDHQVKAVRHQIQQMVLPIALKAAKRIVGKELELYPETIVDIVLQAIAPLSESHRVTLFVHKEDKELLDKEKEKIREILPHVELLMIQEKPDISRGGCIIQTESGMINATIENQWNALERAFEKYKPKTE